MESQSLILGTIDGISKADYDALKKDLQACFEKTAWKDDVLYIRSERRHRRLKTILRKIAGRISESHYGSLLYVGNDKVACIYLGSGKFVGKQYREPKPPDWWGIKERKNATEKISDKLLLNLIER